MPDLSGRDLAREALQQALANARKRGSEPAAKKQRRVTVVRARGGRDPMPLGAAVNGLVTARGWETGTSGGSVLDRWLAIAPQLAPHVTAEHWDAQTCCLHLRPASPAFATQLNLVQAQLLQQINTAMGRPAVRSLRILRPSHQSRPGPGTAPPGPPTAPQPPARHLPAGAPAPPEIRAWREQHRADKATRRAARPAFGTHPLFADAYGHREPADQFREAVIAQEEADAEAARAARQQRRTDGPSPLRTPGAA